MTRKIIEYKEHAILQHPEDGNPYAEAVFSNGYTFLLSTGRDGTKISGSCIAYLSAPKGTYADGFDEVDVALFPVQGLGPCGTWEFIYGDEKYVVEVSEQ